MLKYDLPMGLSSYAEFQYISTDTSIGINASGKTPNPKGRVKPRRAEKDDN